MGRSILGILTAITALFFLCAYLAVPAFVVSVRGSFVTKLDYSRAVELPVDLSAYGALVATPDGRVIAYKDPHRKCEIASTTKLMTCWLAHEELDDESVVKMSSYDLQIAYPFANSADQPWNENAALAIEERCMEVSSNPYAHALARYVAQRRYGASGTDWGDMTNAIRAMDERAAEIGMESTTFVSPSGLFGPGDGVFTEGFSSSSGGMRNNQSTANDMMLLTINAVENGTPTMSLKFGSLGVQAIKTGTNLRESLLSMVEIDGQRYYIVLLAADHTSSMGGTDLVETTRIAEWLRNYVRS